MCWAVLRIDGSSIVGLSTSDCRVVPMAGLPAINNSERPTLSERLPLLWSC
jgi:hypothetical protein